MPCIPNKKTSVTCQKFISLWNENIAEGIMRSLRQQRLYIYIYIYIWKNSLLQKFKT